MAALRTCRTSALIWLIDALSHWPSQLCVCMLCVTHAVSSQRTGENAPLIWICPLLIALSLSLSSPCRQAPRLKTWGHSPQSAHPDRRKRLVLSLSLIPHLLSFGTFCFPFFFFFFAETALLSDSLGGDPSSCTASVLLASSWVFILLCSNPRPGSFALLFTEAFNCYTAPDFVVFMTGYPNKDLKCHWLEGICHIG